MLLRGEWAVEGVRNRDLRDVLYPGEQEEGERRRAAGRVTRLLALLRAHRLVAKVAQTNRWRPTKRGQEVMATALRFRQMDVSLLAV